MVPQRGGPGKRYIMRAAWNEPSYMFNNLGSERKRVPCDVLRDAERLECLLFGGYDPYFVGDEPPGL
jgi:hypothetical protein